MDPFLDLVRLLRPQATLWTRVEASGRWGLSFRQHHDLLFCWVEHGSCQLIRPACEPLPLHKNDFLLVRTTTPFSLASDTDVECANSEAVILGAGAVAVFGDRLSPATILRGGKFVFDTANELLLTGLLPQVMHLPATASPSDRVGMLLRMNEAEASAPRPGSEFVIARLMELILIEILRNRGHGPDHAQVGLLAGLADPVTAKALVAMHENVAQPWTTAKLARLCGTSRSALGARFAGIVGLGPIAYLQQWRMALAKDALRRGTCTVGEIALTTGFQSGSAFSTAFKRAVGCSPSSYSREHR